VITSFIRIILRYGSEDEGIFGHCDSYYRTVEMQGRGSLHCHMLIWLRGHLPPESLASALKTSAEYRTRLVQWLKSIVSSGFKGSRSCFNGMPDTMRKDIGPNPCHPTTVPGPMISTTEKGEFSKEMNEYLDELLLRFNWHYHTGTCWKHLRAKDPRTPANCRFGMDGSAPPNTEIDPGIISLSRLHPRMTHYNPIKNQNRNWTMPLWHTVSVITFLMKCNTDVKFVGSGDDAKAFIYYVTDYITKAPLFLHAGLTALAYAITQGEAGVLSGNGEIETRRAMTIAVNSMLSHQEISHPQVAYCYSLECVLW
ncbi:hypothetical protein FA13DRAFT_1636271, partial [Coprinellus micaceus]